MTEHNETNDSNFSEALLKEDYYSFLNIPKTATGEEINAAYHRLSRTYHPDKHADLDMKTKAEKLFNRTKKAYEVLSDPNKRAIYDSVGEEGLSTDGWIVANRTKTPAEIREEFERLMQITEERKVLQSTNPRGTITVNINATDLFAPYDETNEFPEIEVSSMNINQQVEAPISTRDTIIMQGNMMTSNGNGNGSFVVCGRRLLNRGWFEMDAGAGNGLFLGAKGGRTLSPVLTLNGGASVNIKNNSLTPTLFSALAVQFDRFTIGTLSVNGGSQVSMSTQLDRASEKSIISTSIVIGTPHIYFSIAYTRKMLQNELRLKSTLKVGTFGAIMEYGAEKSISKYSTILAAVSIGVPTGVILKVKVTRSHQTFVFPIHLSDDIVPAAVFYATVTPLLIWFVVKKTIVDPIMTERRRLEVERFKQIYRERIEERKVEAAAAIDLMRDTYDRIVSEESANGLIIKNATYGCYTESSNGKEFIENAFADVTIPLQCLVRKGTLTLYSSSKSGLPGFYDPCIGQEKILRIEYIYDKREKAVVEIKDQESIHLPR